ncbi:hypothetical protein NQ318_019508 [Aromia moschata]|uniref:Dehydrogenase/reductase SDR family member 11 n=1 Tax=Aromia moschata TaxID=1265417 RepID=A0AAV8XYB3_9CUCU|nr:hypothetical protein NQ318_019508 [Aromia moschata]
MDINEQILVYPLSLRLSFSCQYLVGKMVISFDRWVGKVAVVTGASSGIGAAISEQLVEKELYACICSLCIHTSLTIPDNAPELAYTEYYAIRLRESRIVAGLARRKDRLEDLAKKLSGKKGKFFPVKTDISKEEDIVNAFKWIKENLGPVHILVNNAGIFKTESLSEGNTKTWEDILRVNVLGLCIATREAIKDMKANSVDGHIVHINSIAGHRIPSGLHGLNMYPASKYAVRALAETLRLELNSLKSKIKITNVSPGLVDTEIVPDQLRNDKFYEEMKIIEPEQIADGIIYALSTPPHVQIQQLTISPVLDFV